MNHSRLTSITYPNGRVITYNYVTGLPDNISHLSSITDGATTLESYDYLGLRRVNRTVSLATSTSGLTFSAEITISAGRRAAVRPKTASVTAMIAIQTDSTKRISSIQPKANCTPTIASIN